ncbi:PRC-barrel domain-containing protein [Magnetospirillum moscoviense]|nr:PRC-barrel domain-containing protein [Magnetospirillum moscoviense]
MKILTSTAIGLMMTVASVTVSAPAFAQGAPQVISAMDVKSVAMGYRGTKIVGSSINNDKGETIGKIDDMIISKDQRALFAIISVGGYLGIGDKLIAVRYEDLHPTKDDKGFSLPGATKDSLKALPEFVYAK